MLSVTQASEGAGASQGHIRTKGAEVSKRGFVLGLAYTYRISVNATQPTSSYPWASRPPPSYTSDAPS